MQRADRRPGPGAPAGATRHARTARERFGIDRFIADWERLLRRASPTREDIMKRTLARPPRRGHRRRRLHRHRTCAGACSSAATRCSAVDNFYTGDADVHRAACSCNPRFELMRHDIAAVAALRIECDAIFNLACPAIADPLPAAIRCRRPRPACTARQPAGPGQAAARAAPAGVHQRGLRRPGVPPADARLLGPRQPDRPARLLRRRQALRRSAVHGLPPPAARGRSRSRASSTRYGPHMQPGDGRVVSELHRPGADAASR